MDGFVHRQIIHSDSSIYLSLAYFLAHNLKMLHKDKIEYKRLSRILTALDGSEQSMRAAELAISIAVKHDAEILALYVFYSQLGYAYASYLSKIEDSPSIAAIVNSAKQEASHWFEAINNKIAYSKNENHIMLKSEVIVTSTSVPAAIIDYASKNRVNLIVIGTRGRSGIKKVLLGSVAQEVIIESRCPVLVAK
jgi:nucleotide-binding universal stress UspA family protein